MRSRVLLRRLSAEVAAVRQRIRRQEADLQYWMDDRDAVAAELARVQAACVALAERNQVSRTSEQSRGSSGSGAMP